MLERSQATEPIQLGNVAEELTILTTESRTVTLPTRTDGGAPRLIYVCASQGTLVVRPFASTQTPPTSADCIPCTLYSPLLLYCGGMNRLLVVNTTTVTVSTLTVTALDNQ